jgi:hypothetical protein
MAAAIDDARSLAADILEETDSEALHSVRRYLNWALQAIERADADLTVRHQPLPCPATPLGGGQCELDMGHDGKHRKQLWRYDYLDSGKAPTPAGVFEWDDDSQRRLTDKHSSRFD